MLWLCRNGNGSCLSQLAVKVCKSSHAAGLASLELVIRSIIAFAKQMTGLNTFSKDSVKAYTRHPSNKNLYTLSLFIIPLTRKCRFFYAEGGYCTV